MEEYQKVNLCVNEHKSEKISWRTFSKQFLICSSIWTIQFMCGLSIGSPTVFIPQLGREANSTEAVTTEMVSWMSSVYSFSGLLFVIILSILMRRFGRKTSCIFASVNSFLAFLVLFCSTSNTMIIISLAISGVLSAAQTVVSVVVLTEYISPRYRGIFLTAKCAIFYWGIWAANALGTFFHWKKIALVGIICTLYPLVSILFWPESPYWLASKGRFKECSESHRWLKGTDVDSEKELQTLIETQEKYRETRSIVKLIALERAKNLYNTVTSREFYRPTLVALIVAYINLFSGKIMTAVYAIDIMKKITNDEGKAYAGMLILDGITIVSMYVGCGISKFVKRRTMLLVTTSLGVIFMYLLSLYLYLIKLSVIIENTYVSFGLFSVYCIASSSGPILFATCYSGELLPLKSRHFVTCLLAIIIKLTLGVLLKVTPMAVKVFGLHGVYMSYGVTSTVLIVLAYVYIPETKDKTLQDISDSILAPHKNKTRNVLNDEDETVKLRSDSGDCKLLGNK